MAARKIVKKIISLTSSGGFGAAKDQTPTKETLKSQGSRLMMNDDQVSIKTLENLGSPPP